MTRLSLEEVLEGLERHSFLFKDDHHLTLALFAINQIFAKALQNALADPPDSGQIH
ncbi:hypothetical protein Q8309_001392 [Salmonella enterica]|nr:hypothetical protein [Salmonella enterica]